MKKIVLAGGCFWGVAEYYRRLKGVVDTETGYANGNQDTVSYEAVCTGKTGHAEVVKIKYDETQISLNQILDHLFRMIDPLSLNQQGNDKGTQYRTGIYYENDDDLKIITDVVAKQQQNFSLPIQVEVTPLENYCSAEDYHQDYLVKNPQGYCHINFGLIQKDELKS